MEMTNKRLEANRKNCQLGGVKTSQGKSITRFNARKHGILSDLINNEEKSTHKAYVEQLYKELQPNNIIEEMLVERIAIHYMKLRRSMKAENEYMAYVINLDEIDFDMSSADKPSISTDNFEKLISLYQRYEVSTENRFYKAIEELKKLRMGSFGNNDE